MNDRSRGNSRSSDVWLRNTRRGLSPTVRRYASRAVSPPRAPSDRLRVHTDREDADAGLAQQHRGGLLGVEDRARQVVEAGPDAADPGAAQVRAAQPRAAEDGQRQVALHERGAHELAAHQARLGELAALEPDVLQAAAVELQVAGLAVAERHVHAAALREP